MTPPPSDDAGPTGGDDGGPGATPDAATEADADAGAGGGGDGLVGAMLTTYECTVSAEQLAAEMGEGSLYEVTDDGITRTIRINAIPNHSVGAFPIAESDAPANTAVIVPQDLTFEIPVHPSFAADGPTDVDTPGIARSGVPFQPVAPEYWNMDRMSGWRYVSLRLDLAARDLGFDCNYAHPTPPGLYHYHGVPAGMMPEEPERTWIGWAADGYPIFAVWGTADPDETGGALVELASSFRIKEGTRPDGPGGEYDGTFFEDFEYVAGAGDLDECNGRHETVTLEGLGAFDYVYYVTDSFPFVPRCVHGTPDEAFILPGGGGPGGPGGPPGGPGGPPPGGA